MTRIVINGIIYDVPGAYPHVGKAAGPTPGKVGNSWKGGSKWIPGYDSSPTGPLGPVTVVAPDNLFAPTIDGVAQVGEALNGNPGTWAGTSLFFIFQWLVDGIVVAGANGGLYIPTVTDIGKPITFRTIGNNTIGTDTGNSTATANVIAAAGSTLTLGAPVTLTEGNSGVTNFTFPVTRTGSTTGASSVYWAVTSAAANAADFVGGILPSGTLTFGIGVTIQNIIVPVTGDTAVEANEAFTITLSSPSGATIGTGTTTGTITNDDVAPGVGLARSANYIQRSTGVLEYPVKFENNGNGNGYTRPVDWKTGDKALFRWSANPAMTAITEGTIVTLDSQVGANNFGLSAISGVQYIQMAAWDGTQARPAELNWSNFSGVGNATVPSITSTISPAGYQNIAGSFGLTADIPSVFNLISGPDAFIGRVVGNTFEYGVQSVVREYILVFEAVSHFGVKSAPLTVGLDLNVNTPNVFELGANITGAAKNTRVFAPNNVTVLGLATGSTVPFTISGGWEAKKNNTGAYVTSGFLGNTDTLDALSFTTGNSFSIVSPGVVTIASTLDSISAAVMDDPAAAAFNVPASQPAKVAGTGTLLNVCSYPSTYTVGGFAVVYSEPHAFRTLDSVVLIGAGTGGADITLINRLEVQQGSGANWIQNVWTCPGPSDPGGSKPIVNASCITRCTYNQSQSSIGILYGTLTGTPNPVPTSTQTRVFPDYSADFASTAAPIVVPVQGVGVCFGHMNSGTTNLPATTGSKIAIGLNYGGSDIRGIISRQPTAGNWTPTFGPGCGATGLMALAWGQ